MLGSQVHEELYVKFLKIEKKEMKKNWKKAAKYPDKVQ